MKKNIPEKQDGIRKELGIRTYNVDLGNGECTLRIKNFCSFLTHARSSINMC